VKQLKKIILQLFHQKKSIMSVKSEKKREGQQEIAKKNTEIERAKQKRGKI